MSAHADSVRATADRRGATSLVAASWRRCASVHRLDPDARLGPERDERLLRDAQEREARLIAVATPYLHRLFDALGDPDGGISVIDRHGRMIAMRVGGSHDVYRRRPEHWLGSDLSEAAIGTNGNGTCLVEERPVVIGGEDHFLSMLTHTTCVAAPIFGPDGNLAGCLNVLTQAANPSAGLLEQLARIAVRTMAQRIEIELFAAAFPTCRLMLASGASHDIGALLSVDGDDVVVGATRAARRLLELTSDDLRNGLDLATLAGTGGSQTVAESERKLVARVLARHRGNVARASRSLGISRSTLYRKMAGLDRRSPDALAIRPVR